MSLIDKINRPAKARKEAENKKWKDFRRLCWHYTNKNDLTRLENFEKRGFHGYHLDHRISIFDGYRKGLSPCFLGGIHNLKMIPYKENMSKGVKSII